MEAKEILEKGKARLKRFGAKEWGMVLLAGVCLLVIALPSGGSKEAESEAESRNKGSEQHEQTGETQEADSYVRELEERLEGLLRQVDGIGNVKVMITASATTEVVVLKDRTQETSNSTERDSQGGSRSAQESSQEEETILVNAGQGDAPYIVKKLYPEIEGVVVIAEGSRTGTVDLDILTAVQVLFGVPAHKIKIMKMKK